MILLIVFSPRGEAAAFRLEELIHEDKRLSDVYDVVKWGEKQYNDNRYSKDGEVSNYTIFIGNIKATEPIKKISKIRYNDYGIIYSISGKNAVITANSKKLISSPDMHNKFLKEVHVASPNRIEDATHGIKKFRDCILHGYRGMNKQKIDTEEQQLLFGITMFFKKELLDFVKELEDDQN